ncbi:LOW QUALITY PROTEIN: phosphatidylinositol-3,5-bisphosphate 3-phosphatase MTMR3-like [Urocitellus parryii]
MFKVYFQDEETRHSLECIQANQIFPRKQLIQEDENLQVPSLELHGESTEYVGRDEDAIIALSDYRLHIKFKESLVNTTSQSATSEIPVPLQLIESIECRDIFQLHLTCKDCKVIRCQFSTFEQCQDWLKRLNNAIRPPAKIEDLFSFAYHAWCVEVYSSEKEQHGDLCRSGDHVTSRFKNEVERMGFDMNNDWRFSNINEKYKLCDSYLQELLVAAWITDKELESVASFRFWKCIPAVVYRHQSNGAVIAHCGQPEVSWWGWRNADDEHFVQSVAKACASDFQSSGGSKPSTRNSSQEFPNGGDLSDVVFDSSLSNASGAESLAIQLQKLLILDARSYAAAVANRAKGGGCKCPNYYLNCEVVFMGMANIHSIRRSFQSLRLLCTQTPDPRKRGGQLRQFPCSFEFNEAFLVKLVQHTYSCLFGTFLCNNAKERGEKHTQETCSVWSLLRTGNKAFKNLLYSAQSEVVLYPVCHVHNLMLWSAVYLPCPSLSTPVDDSCAPYPVPGTSPDDPPLSRLPKTRSFENLTIACDSTVLLASRRSSDPSLNEKWQEHQRSLELSNLAGPGEEPSADSLGKPSRARGAVLSVAAGVAEEQMENILQEATKEESGGEVPAHRGSVEMPQIKEENRIATEGSAIVLYQEAELGVAILRSHPDSSLSLFSQGIPEEQGGPSVLSSSLQEPYRGEDSLEVPLEQPPIEDIAENQEDAAPSIPVDVKVGYSTPLSSSLPPSQVPFETRGPNMDSSMDMLMEDNVKSESGPQVHCKPCLVITGRFSGKDVLPPALEPRPAERSLIEKPRGSVVHTTSPGSTLSPTRAPCALPLAKCKEGFVCNGAPETENKASEQPPALGTLQKYSTPNGHCANAEAGRSKDSLSRQLSATGCSSVHLHSRNLHHKWLHSHSGRPSAVSSPEHPSRSHLDDDGMPVYTDTIQQCLRQIESGHQQEVETLKKQVQELKSCLESQYLTGSLRFNGDFGDEVTSIPDLESNLDQNCLSRCSTEIFSEASWEQVDKQDTEMTCWLPDHLAAHCYACDSAFWLASRKHHCRDTDRVDQTWNCGNVFCSSCYNQKVLVPSQQLSEPSRVSKSCYSSLHPTSFSIDLELDKPIAATSN